MTVKKTDQALDVCLCTFHYSWSSEAHFSVLVWSKNVTSIGINNLGTIQLNVQVKRSPSGYRQSGRSIAVRQQGRNKIKNGGRGAECFCPPFPLPPISNKRWPLSFFVRRRQHFSLFQASGWWRRACSPFVQSKRLDQDNNILDPSDASMLSTIITT